MRSRGSHASAGAHWRPPAAGWQWAAGWLCGKLGILPTLFGTAVADLFCRREEAPRKPRARARGSTGGSPSLRWGLSKGSGANPVPQAPKHLVCQTGLAFCPPFLGAEACEAEVRTLPLVLIGGLLPPGGVGVEAARRKPADRATVRAASNALRVRSLPLPASLFIIPSNALGFRSRLPSSLSRLLVPASSA